MPWISKKFSNYTLDFIIKTEKTAYAESAITEFPKLQKFPYFASFYYIKSWSFMFCPLL